MNLTDERPDPDALLDIANAETPAEDIGDAAPARRRGRLKIFLGMCAGVGKTYTMLQDARALSTDGLDVLIGYVETHGRPDTEALLEGLPILPRKQVPYRGAIVRDFDLDAALARRPGLIVVDELPHSNAPGSRHPKRYQDVLELLEAGIDVHTALNVQHLESRADAVAQITGVPVRETVPDTILERADEIELIDLSPDELLKRLAEGKVYLGDGRAAAAANSFFRKGNLNALREMALRITAERVDKQMRDYMRIKRISGPWKSTDRLMVAVNDSALSERLIRHARRLAYTLDAPWVAVHVETSAARGERERAGVERNLALARELGAEVVNTADDDIAHGLLRVAQQYNVSQIVVGRPRESALRRLLGGGTLVARLIDLSSKIDVHVVGGEDLGHSPTPRPIVQFHSTPLAYAQALGVMLLVVLSGYGAFLTIRLQYQVMALVFLFAIVLLSLRFARGPVLAATVLSAAGLDFLFIPPYFTLDIDPIGDTILFALYFAIAVVIGVLTTRIRNTAVLLRQREAQVVASFEFASDMSRAVTMDDVCRVATERLGALFDAPVRILLPDIDRQLQVGPGQPQPATKSLAEDRELGVATWAFEHARPAGKQTDTLPTATAQHVPMLTSNGAVGVISIDLKDRLSTQQSDLLRGLVSQAALAVEREQLDEASKQRSVLEESERLSKTLLNLISHELRTPITAITGAASSLTEPDIDSDPAARLALHESIQSSATRLNQLIDNLLDMTRLESGTLKLNADWTEVADLIRTVRERAAGELAAHELIVDVSPDLPLVRMDIVLMEQVLYNLLRNAALYTPAGTRVRLSAQREGNELILAVMDRGPGLPLDELPRAFDKFRRGGTGNGLGLGLSICKGLVEAHRGSITAENRTGGGLRVVIRLPIEPMPAIPEAKNV
ncbi:MAG: sensor histidine kinase KdpD [Burkholderiaceae bacterium]|nr:sensor histidine kinase KdpD [Burkholderiaceae bacterium]